MQLTPFVTKKVPAVHGQYEGNPLGPKDPAVYLARWKAENGLD
jgi:large subunit ribosomal protein L41